MKKPLVICILLLGITMLVMPYITGRVAESASLQLAKQINAGNVNVGELSIEEYQRDYFSSQSRIQWVPKSALNSQVKLTLDCDGHHGVLAFKYSCKSDSIGAYRDFVDIELEGDDPLTISGKVSLLGNITQRFELASFEFTNQEKEKIEILAAELQIRTDRHANSFKISGTSQGLKAVGENGVVKIGQAQLKGDVRISEENFVLGELDATLADIELTSSNDGNSVMRSLNVVVDSQENSDTMEFGYKLRLADFVHTPYSQSTDKEEAGEPSDVAILTAPRTFSDLNLDLRLAGVNTERAALLKQKWQALPDSSSKDNKASMLALVPEIEAMFTKGLALRSNAAAEFQSKKMQANFDLALVGDLKFGDYLLLKINPKSLFSKLQSKLHSKVPKEILSLKPGADEAVSNNPLYQEMDGFYHSDIELKDAEVVINGTSYTLEQVAALLLK